MLLTRLKRPIWFCCARKSYGWFETSHRYSWLLADGSSFTSVYGNSPWKVIKLKAFWTRFSILRLENNTSETKLFVWMLGITSILVAFLYYVIVFGYCLSLWSILATFWSLNHLHSSHMCWETQVRKVPSICSLSINFRPFFRDCVVLKQLTWFDMLYDHSIFTF